MRRRSGRVRADCIGMLGGALVAWFVLAMWSFAGGGLVDYLLFIVSAFLFVTVALSRPARRHASAGRSGALATRMGDAGVRNLDRPAQRHGGGSADSSADCGRARRHDGDPRICCRRRRRKAGSRAQLREPAQGPRRPPPQKISRPAPGRRSSLSRRLWRMLPPNAAPRSLSSA